MARPETESPREAGKPRDIALAEVTHPVGPERLEIERKYPAWASQWEVLRAEELFVFNALPRRIRDLWPTMFAPFAQAGTSTSADIPSVKQMDSVLRDRPAMARTLANSLGAFEWPETERLAARRTRGDTKELDSSAERLAAACASSPGRKLPLVTVLNADPWTRADLAIHLETQELDTAVAQLQKLADAGVRLPFDPVLDRAFREFRMHDAARRSR